MDAALADAARRGGPWLVCRPGCTQCCHGAFAINELDARRLHAGMAALHASDPEVAEAVRARARAWLRQFGPAFPGDPATGILGTSDQDQARFEDFANDAPCPALDPETGLCAVYAWRPMTCRVFGPPVRVESNAVSSVSSAPPRPRSPPAQWRFRMSTRRVSCSKPACPMKPWWPSPCSALLTPQRPAKKRFRDGASKPRENGTFPARTRPERDPYGFLVVEADVEATRLLTTIADGGFPSGPALSPPAGLRGCSSS
jgi:Fe-S-cluster containining protein